MVEEIKTTGLLEFTVKVKTDKGRYHYFNYDTYDGPFKVIDFFEIREAITIDGIKSRDGMIIKKTTRHLY